MRWTDTHCHLNHPDLYPEWRAALFRAQQSGVERLILIGYDLESSRRAVELAAQSDALYAAVGIHPHDAAQCDADALATLRQLAQQPRVVAVGEIGLDFYRDLSPRAAQYEAFHAQMQLAQAQGLPVILHCTIEKIPGVLAERSGVGVWGGFSPTQWLQRVFQNESESEPILVEERERIQNSLLLPAQREQIGLSVRFSPTYELMLLSRVGFEASGFRPTQGLKPMRWDEAQSEILKSSGADEKRNAP